MHQINPFFIQSSVINAFGQFSMFQADCTTSAVWQPKNTLINSQPSQRRSHQSLVCVCLCVFLSACYVLCITPVFIVFSSWSCFSFLLLFMSVLVCLAAVQVLVVGCFRKCTWLSWEVRWAICPQATPLPWPPLFFCFFFNKFYQLLTGSKAPLCTAQKRGRGPSYSARFMQRSKPSRDVIVCI